MFGFFKNQVAILEERITHLKDDMSDLERRMVTQSEFYPIKRVVYGAVGLILIGVISALVGLVMVK